MVLLRRLPDRLPRGPGPVCRCLLTGTDRRALGRLTARRGRRTEVRPGCRTSRPWPRRWTPSTTSPTRAWPRRCSSPSGCRSRCCWRASRASARPRPPRRWPAVLDTPLYRLQCFEGIDAAEALYEWNHPRQLLGIRLAEARGAPLGRGRPVRPRSTCCGARCCRPSSTRGRGRPCCSRRDRPGRRRVRGVHVRGARRGRGDRAGAGHHPGRPPAGRRPHLQPDPRPARRAHAPLPVPLDRLPGPGAGGRDRPPPGARQRRAAGAWPRRPRSTRLRTLDLVKPPGIAEAIDWVGGAAACSALTRLDAAAVEATLGRGAQEPRRPGAGAAPAARRWLAGA